METRRDHATKARGQRLLSNDRWGRKGFSIIVPADLIRFDSTLFSVWKLACLFILSLSLFLSCSESCAERVATRWHWRQKREIRKEHSGYSGHVSDNQRRVSIQSQRSISSLNSLLYEEKILEARVPERLEEISLFFSCAPSSSSFSWNSRVLSRVLLG